MKGELPMLKEQHLAFDTPQTLSLTDYASHYANMGIPTFPGRDGTFWASYESGALMRIPMFHLEPPASHEVRDVLWHGRKAVASYVIEPDEQHPPNAWFYLCTDQDYTLEKLAPAMRRNVRRGLKELTIAPLTPEQLLTQGTQAYCDTRRRTGLNDGTPEEFLQRIALRSRMPEVVWVGAWKDDALAAFLSITVVDDWAEIGCFSCNALLQYRPNDTLMYYALSHYLVERKFRLVSYGLSSIQAESNAAGLHKFKLKVGFDAHPVHRAFVPHPLLRPFANRLTLWGVNAALHVRPRTRLLKKAGGALAYMLGDTSLIPAVSFR